MPGTMRSLASSFLVAFRGVIYLLRTQRNGRIHLAAALLVGMMSVWLGVSSLEGAVLVLTISLVFAAEMLNTALEALADAACPRHHPLVGAAKDVAAGAVLVAAAGAVVVGLLVLGPKLPALLSR